jgi:formamidopyrimidine-DNA glycosylase
MPEGPEAKYLAAKMHNELHGKNLQSVSIINGRYKKHGPPENYHKFVATLPLKLEHVYSKGKVIIFQYEKGWNIISKLGLMGWWYTKDKPTWREPHPNVLFHFGSAGDLTFSDTLSYGTLSFINDPAKLEKELNQLGLDILADDTTSAKFINAFETLTTVNKKKPIEEIITDQQLAVSGIGNYLKAEILYDAKISPKRKVEDITKSELQHMYKSARKIAKRFLKALWHDLKKTKETYLDSFKVYRKEEDPLGNKVETYKNKLGRTTYWVPAVQK